MILKLKKMLWESVSNVISKPSNSQIDPLPTCTQSTWYRIQVPNSKIQFLITKNQASKCPISVPLLAEDKEAAVGAPVVHEIVRVQATPVAVPDEVRDVATAAGERERRTESVDIRGIDAL